MSAPGLHPHLVEPAVRALADALPAGWTRAWMRIEAHADGSGNTAMAYAGVGVPERVVAISLAPRHIAPWQRLRHAMAETAEPWTSTTVTLDSNGHFDLQHHYEQLDDAPATSRYAEWARTIPGVASED